MENAKRIADFVALPEQACDFAYACSRYPQASREEWNKSVRLSFAIRTMLASAAFPTAAYFSLYPDVVDELRTCASSSAGNLFLLYHGAFERLATAIFRRAFPEGKKLGLPQATRQPVQTLFQATRLLRDGETIMIAPDGIISSTESSPDDKRKIRWLDVLGLKWPVGEGAAVLAYESRCEIFSLSVELADRGLVPLVARERRRDDGERFQEFRTRFWRFYAQQLENALAGDPRSLPISGVTYLLNLAQAQTVSGRAKADQTVARLPEAG
jgi:hypothetical protein